MLAAALVAALLLLAGPAAAKPGNPPLRVAAQSLIELFNGRAKPEAVFTPEFLAQVPAAQTQTIAASLRDQVGRPLSVSQVEPQDGLAGTARLKFERGTVSVRIALTPAAPHLLRGLLITAVERDGDSLDKVVQEIRGLPGAASLALARLDTNAPTVLVATEPGRPLAIGSVFKLFILAELDRQVRAGECKWTDVVPLTRKSLPSGFLQDWPADAPVTLHSLAALMISQSDNSASDTLLHLLGREKVEAMLPQLGIRSTAANRPFLSTLEAFALKGGDQALARRWLATDEAGRRKLLAKVAAVTPEQIDVARLQARPNHIDVIEWFASAEDLVRTLDWLRRNGSKETLGILAINPGLPRPTSQPFAYWGYKGGSETGVIAMTFLLRDKAGAWHVLAASWNNPQAAVDEQRFALLMSRTLSLIGR